MHVLMRGRKRERGDKKRGRNRGTSRLCTDYGALPGAPFLDPKIMTPAEIKSWMHN